MALVEALRRNLTGMVDPHQAGGMGFLIVGEVAFRDTVGWVRPSRLPGWRRDSAQGIVQTCQQTIEGR